MKVALICPVGRSPGAVTEMVRYLEPEGLTDVILFPTQEEFVLASARLVEAAIKVTYPRIRVHLHILPCTDVLSEEDNLRVMEAMSRAICKEKFKFNTDKIYLNIAGGRKATTICMGVIGELLGVTALYHVINREIEGFNEYQEIIREDIRKFIEPSLEKRIEMYREKREVFDKLLFPRGELLEFIKIPLIPHTPKEIQLLQRLLTPRGIYFDEEPVSPETLEIYKRYGLIEYNNYRAWPTDLGLRIGKMLRCEL